MVQIMYSLADWRRPQTLKPEDIVPLGEECENFHTTPSEQIYYYNYPYKVSLKNHIDVSQNSFDIRRDIVMRKLMLEEFQENELTGKIRSYVSVNNQRVYLRNHKDLCTFISFFHTEIEGITGPISKEHSDLLLGSDYYCAVRAPYYGKFDVKIFVSTLPKDWKTRVSFGSAFNAAERRSIIQDANNYLRENIPEEKQYWNNDLYTTNQELQYILPFFKLRCPEARLIVTKCLLK